MTMQELAVQENLLYSTVMKLYHQPQTPEVDEKLEHVFADYRKVHQAYANLAESDIEALKKRTISSVVCSDRTLLSN